MTALSSLHIICILYFPTRSLVLAIRVSFLCSYSLSFSPVESLVIFLVYILATNPFICIAHTLSKSPLSFYLCLSPPFPSTVMHSGPSSISGQSVFLMMSSVWPKISSGVSGHDLSAHQEKYSIAIYCLAQQTFHFFTFCSYFISNLQK